jgi:rhodanese-related sulfurtransferase
MTPLSATELATWLSEAPHSDRGTPQLIDVREPWEYETCHLSGSALVPMRELVARIDEIDSARPVVCICHHGGRSAQVAHYLETRGMTQVFNLSGGLERWSLEVDPSFPRY